jgi:hypothetical protein
MCLLVAELQEVVDLLGKKRLSILLGLLTNQFHFFFFICPHASTEITGNQCGV